MIIKDIVNALKVVYKDWFEDKGHVENSEYEYFDRIIQSLNKPKLPDVINLEMEEICIYQGQCTKDRCLMHPCDEKFYKVKTEVTLEGEIINIKI